MKKIFQEVRTKSEKEKRKEKEKEREGNNLVLNFSF